MKHGISAILSLCTAGFTSTAEAATAAYWSLFNFEGESAISSAYVTYNTLADMLADTNRVSETTPGSFARNVVGSGSDGKTYWSLFNMGGRALYRRPT